MSLLEKDGYIVDLGFEDRDSGQPDIALAQSVTHTAGANRTPGTSHTTTWHRTYTRRQVKVGQLSAAQWASFKFFYEEKAVGYKNSFAFTDDYGATSTAKIDGDPEASRLGLMTLPAPIGLTQVYSLSFWIEVYP